VLFIDNKEKNIVGAKNLGMNTARFESINPLKEILQKL